MPQIIKNANDSFGTESLPAGTGEMVAIDVKMGKVLWDTKLPSSPYGDATVTNDLVFTTLLNGTVVAYSTKTPSWSTGQRAPTALGRQG
jgi:hypothetical protein